MNKRHPIEQMCGNRFLNRPLPVGGAQRAVGRHADVLRPAVVDQLLLGQIWVAFDLGERKQRQKEEHGPETLILRISSEILLANQSRSVCVMQ